MQRKWLLFITGINCLLVFGLIVWVFVAQSTPRPGVERRSMDPPEPASLEELVEQIRTSKHPLERVRAIRALPDQSESIAVLEAVLVETLTDESIREWIQLQSIAFEKYAALLGSADAVIHEAKRRVADSAMPLPLRDHALRVAVQAVAQAGSAEGAGVGTSLSNALDELITIAWEPSNTSLPGTALLGLAYLHGNQAGSVTREELVTLTKTALDDEAAIENTVLCALQVIADKGLEELADLVTARISRPGSDAVLLRAMAALSVIGDEAAIHPLEALQPATAEQYHAAAQAIERIRARSMPQVD